MVVVDGWLIKHVSVYIQYIRVRVGSSSYPPYISSISIGDLPCNLGVVGSNPTGGLVPRVRRTGTAVEAATGRASRGLGVRQAASCRYTGSVRLGSGFSRTRSPTGGLTPRAGGPVGQFRPLRVGLAGTQVRQAAFCF
jgi:hypothetical protein